MPDADPYKVFVDARGRIRDAAKWIVTVLGSVIVLIAGSGLIANIPALDPAHIVGAAACLIALTALCAYPFIAAVRILVSPFVSFAIMATDHAFGEARAVIDHRLKAEDPSNGILYIHTRRAALRTAHDAARDERARAEIEKKQETLEGQIRSLVEQISLVNLEIRFETFVGRMKRCAVGVGLVVPLFFFVRHADGGGERMVGPNFIAVALTPETVSALTRSGFGQHCYSNGAPAFVRVSEITGVGAGVVVVPSNSGGCQPVRVILTDQGKIEVVDKP